MIPNPYPIEVQTPDITPYRQGNVGVDYVSVFDSGHDGPTVMIAAVTHGNEICGAVALDLLFKENVRPTRGRLILTFNNHAAYHAFDPEDPNASRYVDQDLNRVWSADKLDGAGDTVELRRARELRPFVEQADYLLDIHSMFYPIAPLMLCGPLAKGRDFARSLRIPRYVASDGGHAEGVRMRDYGGFSAPDSAKNALLIECGQHWSRHCSDVAVETSVRYLESLDVVDGDWAASHIPTDPPPPQDVIEVTHPITIESDRFAFAEDYQGYEVIAKAGTVIAQDGDDPVTTPYDDCVLVMPSMRLEAGRTAVRLGRYVGEG